MTTNAANHDAALALAKTVGTNLSTLRKNKRKLAYNLVMATAVEGFGWTDVWASAKKAMGFAKLDKPEQNQINVLGTACKTIILAWPTLADDVKDAFRKEELIFSTLATSIKDAEKARDKAEADAEATAEASAEASSHADADIDGKPEAEASDRTAMIEEVAAMFDADMDAASFTPSEIAALADLIAKVDAFKAATIAKASKAA